MSASTTRSWRRKRCSSSSSSLEQGPVLRRRSGGGCVHSPSTRAWRTNSSRACSGSTVAVADQAVGHDGQAVERHPLVGHGRAPAWSTSAARCSCASPGGRPAPRPTRGWMRATVRAHSREVSTSSAAITQSGGFLASAEPGKMAKRALRAPEVLAGLAVLLADVGQQAGQQRPVDEVGRRPARAFWVMPRSADDPAQLGVHVLPLADPQVVQVLAAAQPAELARRQLALLLAQVAPQVQEGQEVRASGRRSGRGAGRRPAAWSAGRSRGSWIDRPAAMTSTSRRQPLRSASSTMRPKRGSIGQPGQAAADGVRRSRPSPGPVSSAPSSCEQADAVGDGPGGRAGRGTGRRRCRPGRWRSSAG